MSIKNYSQQWINDDDISAVTDALRAPFLTGGPSVEHFERAVAEYVSAKCCIALNSATSALHVACLALGINERSLVWTSSISFVASANCAKYCGAEVDFVDIDPETFVISTTQLASKLKIAKKQNKLPDLLIVVHLGGLSADMKEIHKLSKIYNFRIVEDASHALSALYDGKRVGACHYSDLCVFSFHPVKIITTLEGGVVTTNNPRLCEKLKLLRSHYISPSSAVSAEPWEYEQTGLGYNFRMNDVQAALGISQLSRIEEFKEKRLELAYEYGKLLDLDNISIQKVGDLESSSFHLFIITLNGANLKQRRSNLYKKLLSVGYKTNVHYIPIHTQPYYSSIRAYSDLSNSNNYYTKALSLPLYPSLNKIDVEKIVRSVNNA